MNFPELTREEIETYISKISSNLPYWAQNQQPLVKNIFLVYIFVMFVHILKGCSCRWKCIDMIKAVTDIPRTGCSENLIKFHKKGLDTNCHHRP